MPAVGSSGPLNATVMIVGEAPGREEVLAGEPFVGVSGQELNKLLHESGFNRADCRIANVCGYRPPENSMNEWISENKKPPFPDWKMSLGRWVHPLVFDGIVNLKAEIDVVKPELIICMGNTSMWAVTGNWGITTWRGSQLLEGGRRVLPTYHPAAVLRQWSWRHITVHDLKRGRRWLDTNQLPPEYRFIVRPSFEDVRRTLDYLLERTRHDQLHLAVDIETRDKKIGCIGLAWSRLDAICIPLMTFLEGRFDSYWTEDEEFWIFLKLRELLTHKNCLCIGQNFIYDSQYFAKELGYLPNLQWDIMSTHHLMFLELPKALHFQASMYAEWYKYWKDDGKFWDPLKMPNEKHWAYNCTDGVYTWEIASLQRMLT